MIRKIAIAFFALVVILLAAAAAWYFLVMYDPPPVSDEDRAQVTLMPLPASLELGAGTVDVSAGFDIHLPGNDDGRVASFLKRRVDVLRESASGVPLIIRVSETPEDGPVKVLENESYTLIVGKEIELEAATVTGALRGLSTLYQLVAAADDGKIRHMETDDQPRYPWRGLMLDVCRHWMPREVVLRTLDAMELTKMNVLHLHLSEDQGFRVESKRFPRLHEVGPNGKYYTQEDIRLIVQEAHNRGIRVVPEFDLPGHSKSWQIAYPRLSASSAPQQFGSYKGITFTAPVNPAREYTYEFMDAFIEEMAGLFPDPYFHIGGDEVNPRAWLENDSIVQFMQENDLEDAHALQTYFINRMNDLITRHGKTMIGWEEVYQPGLDPDVVIQSWKSQKSLFHAVQGGSRGILSAGYYLDLILPAEEHYAVDPAVIPNAVDIQPDSGRWQLYDLELMLGDNPMSSQLVIFDRDPEQVFGLMTTLDQMSAFTGGQLEDDRLTFEMDTQYGTMTFDGEIKGDSVHGKVSVAMIGVDLKGTKAGGSDMPDGKPLPEIEYLPPLTEEEKDRILGGEACMWSEFVNMHNVESRLWPRAAAIAEKLWTPARLTNDVSDMYRRLAATDDLLHRSGSLHRENAQQLLAGICQGPCLDALSELSLIFEEVKYHARMTGLMELDTFYLPDTPLDQLVDAVRPESPQARQFNEQVRAYQSGQPNDSLRNLLVNKLSRWQKLARDLQAYVPESEKLRDIEQLLPAIEQLSAAAIRRLRGAQAGMEPEEISRMLQRLEQGDHYVIVAIYPGLQAILLQDQVDAS